MTTKYNKGFTLIEAMIVVAIVGILVAVSLPLYSRYQDKSRVQAGLYEVSAPKGQFESLVNVGDTNITLEELGIFTSSSANCAEIIYNYNAGIPEWSLSCKLKGSPLIANRTISIVRDANGTWMCKTGTTGGLASIPNDIKPVYCN